MNIVIYGGRTCTEKYYSQVYEFVKNKLNNPKYNIICGGTSGEIEAVSKAAFENNAKITAVTLNSYKNDINKYVSEVIEFDNEFDRMKYKTDIGDVFLVLDGDIGTLEELFLTWVYVLDTNKKIYILGEKLQNLLKYMYKENSISKDYQKFTEFITMEEFNLKNL